MKGFVFYQGLSRIDRKPIVGIATLKSSNRKTGNIVQTWILRSDMSPLEAIQTGEDRSICGDCPLRGTVEESESGPVNKQRGCYVLTHTAPLQIFRSYKSKKYPKFDRGFSDFLAERHLRYGAYGDPVAIPIKEWDKFVPFCTGKNHLGYTHQWKKKKFKAWSKRLMASTHSEAENELAHALGWRTFRTVVKLTDMTKLEIVCPASRDKDKDNPRTCETCGICDGRSGMNDQRRSVIIVGHGSHKKPFVDSVIESTRIALPLI